MNIGDFNIKWLGNSGFHIKAAGKHIYIDPYMVNDGLEKADLILVSHSHYDNCSIADIKKIIQPSTVVVLPADAQSKVTRFDFSVDMRILEPGQEIEVFGFKICAVPAYNLHTSFHPMDEGWMGFVLKYNDSVLYHAGDTDNIPEMQKLTGYGQKDNFVALLPVSGRFVMGSEEAAEAAELIKPSLAIPMGFGTTTGTVEDAKEFVNLCEERGIRASMPEKD